MHSEEEMPIGSEYWQIIPELIPAKDEVRIEKIHGSSFRETKLGEILKDQDISHLYISGAQSENCVNATTVDALERGMKVTLISDAHTTDDASVLASITQKFEDSQKCGHAIVVESLERILPLN